MALGGTEWLIIALVIILVFGGAKKIPELARSAGRARGEFERGKMDVEKEIAAERAAGHAGHEWTCGKCGAKSGAEAGFCPKCGTAKPGAAA